MPSCRERRRGGRGSVLQVLQLVVVPVALIGAPILPKVSADRDKQCHSSGCTTSRQEGRGSMPWCVGFIEPLLED